MKPKAKPLPLQPGESILAVVPEYASGPGWANRPLWVFIGNYGEREFRAECIQPEDQTPEMHALFAPGAAMCAALKAVVPTKHARKAA